MADDPWRKPDPDPQVFPPSGAAPPPYRPPNPYGPPPVYGPPPTYGVPPYGPPGSLPYNPYQAPLPKRGGVGRLLWVLCTLGVLVLGGCGVGIYFLATSVTKNADEVNSFLRDVRDQRFTAAYQHLCPGIRAGVAATQFTGALQAAAARGHGVSSFDITSSNTSVSTGSGSTRTASGTVTFNGGVSTPVTFALDKSGGSLCILTGYSALF